MIAAEIIVRLTERCGASFALIEGAVELAAIVDDRPPASPAAYVVPLREVSGDNERMTGVLQRSEIDVAVVIILDNLSDTTGAAGAADLDGLRQCVKTALIGWQPASAEDVITHVSGELTKARGGTLWWEEAFATAVYLEQET